ncbi:uncharacterized protein LOC114445682 [Parambassis ranga]|uniref:Uncharacterized protein LOC114445682 n=1 Tax=Parambassis ranga TaxID=210632 RepID=A0A6P7JI22_9TELE|nr:uncharacterized protein LOC114445682 [Parambassis ranga]
MNTRRNERGYEENFVPGRHLKLNELRAEAEAVGLSNQYLFKNNIPEYPRPEFHVTHLKHDTEQHGLRGIMEDLGFKNPGTGSLLWWSLAVGPEEITSAERRLLETSFPDQTDEQAAKQQSFLWKFASSPAFLETSRLGSYRFTFPLQEVLKAYSQQFCSGGQPVMRVFKTILYKQEVVYVVLVHSPDSDELFSGYPLLTDDPNAVCSYRDNCFIWRPEATCETHRYQLITRPDENQMEVLELSGYDTTFYVWDNVAVALHMDNNQVLTFDADQLRQNLKFCSPGYPPISRSIRFDSFEKAQEVVQRLWPDYDSPLQETSSLQEIFGA